MSLVVAQLLFAVDFRFVARFSSWVCFFLAWVLLWGERLVPLA